MAETLGDRIRMHRARCRLSQSALGGKVGLSTNGISLIERGEVDPRASVIRAIADVLGVSTDYLLGRKDTWGAQHPPKRRRKADTQGDFWPAEAALVVAANGLGSRLVRS